MVGEPSAELIVTSSSLRSCGRVRLGRQRRLNLKRREARPRRVESARQLGKLGVLFKSPLTGPDVSDNTTLDLFAALQAALGPQYRLQRELGRGGMGVVFQ